MPKNINDGNRMISFEISFVDNDLMITTVYFTIDLSKNVVKCDR